MSSVLARLQKLRDDDADLTLDALGGIDTVLADRDGLLSSPEMPLVVSLILQDWERLADPQAAVSLIVGSVLVQSAFALEDIVDDSLSAPEAVPSLAVPISKALLVLSDTTGPEAGIALEALVRLALGGWTPSLTVRAKLIERAVELAAEGTAAQPDPVLVQRIIRCLGAVAERWNDDDVPPVLRDLLVLEDIADDVTFELGMHHLRAGLTHDDLDGALTELRTAHSWLDQCSLHEDRIDARIFHSAIGALLTFAAGGRVEETTLAHLHSLVLDYRLISLNEHPTWREPRADTTVQWLDLLDRLHALHDIDVAWWHPAEIISGIARAYAAHRSMRLLAAPDVVHKTASPAAAATPALPKMIQPRLISSLTDKADSMALLDRWLEEQQAAPTTDPADNEAILELRALLHTGGDDTRPKGPAAVDVTAISTALALPPDIQQQLHDALSDRPALVQSLNAFSTTARAMLQPDLSEYVNDLVATLRSDLAQTAGINGEVALRSEQLTVALVRFVRWSIEVETGGPFGEPYLRPFDDAKKAPKEKEFAEDLARQLSRTLPSRPYMEVKNISAGRIDIIFFHGAFRLVIECKRELHNNSHDYLSSRYTIQPAEYGATDVPVGFLAVLDLVPKDRRPQLHQCLWVTEVPPAEPDGRPHAVLVARIPGNTRSPSDASTPSAHLRRQPTTQG